MKRDSFRITRLVDGKRTTRAVRKSVKGNRAWSSSSSVHLTSTALPRWRAARSSVEVGFFSNEKRSDNCRGGERTRSRQYCRGGSASCWQYTRNVSAKRSVCWSDTRRTASERSSAQEGEGRGSGGGQQAGEKGALTLRRNVHGVGK